jgi:hypothetical protein
LTYGAGHDRRPTGSAEPCERVELPVGLQSPDDLGCATAHRLKGGTSIALRGQVVDVDACRLGQLLPRDVLCLPGFAALLE